MMPAGRQPGTHGPPVPQLTSCLRPKPVGAFVFLWDSLLES